MVGVPLLKSYSYDTIPYVFFLETVFLAPVDNIVGQNPLYFATMSLSGNRELPTLYTVVHAASIFPGR